MVATSNMTAHRLEVDSDVITSIDGTSSETGDEGPDGTVRLDAVHRLGSLGPQLGDVSIHERLELIKLVLVDEHQHVHGRLQRARVVVTSQFNNDVLSFQTKLYFSQKGPEIPASIVYANAAVVVITDDTGSYLNVPNKSWSVGAYAVRPDDIVPKQQYLLPVSETFKVAIAIPVTRVWWQGEPIETTITKNRLGCIMTVVHQGSWYVTVIPVNPEVTVISHHRSSLIPVTLF